MSLLFALAAAASVTAAASAQCVSLGQAATDAGLTALVDAITAIADLPGAEPILSAVTAEEPVSEPITVFAPTNEAFEEIMAITDDLPLNTILQVLANHVVGVELTAETILAAIAEESPVVTTSLLGLTLEASLANSMLVVTPTGTEIMAKVVLADLETCAGVVHVIDTVLVPDFSAEPGEEEEVAGGVYGDAGAYGA